MKKIVDFFKKVIKKIRAKKEAAEKLSEEKPKEVSQE